MTLIRLLVSTDRYEGERMIERTSLKVQRRRLGNTLSEVKPKFYEESEMNLDDAQALDALPSSFRTVETEVQERASPIQALS